MARENDVETRWLRRFQRLPPAAVETAMAQLQREAARLVAIMRAGVPVDQAVLQQSIRIEESRRTRAAATIEIRAGGAATTQQIGGRDFHYDYAFAVEFGTQYVAAQPFFFPAYRLRRKAIRSAIKRAVSRGVKAAFER